MQARSSGCSSRRWLRSARPSERRWRRLQQQASWSPDRSFVDLLFSDEDAGAYVANDAIARMHAAAQGIESDLRAGEGRSWRLPRRPFCRGRSPAGITLMEQQAMDLWQSTLTKGDWEQHSGV